MVWPCSGLSSFFVILVRNLKRARPSDPSEINNQWLLSTYSVPPDLTRFTLIHLHLPSLTTMIMVLKVGPCTSSDSITWAFGGKVNSQAPPGPQE